MDYNKIKTFQVVAREQSISKAANILHRTQSAISQQIAHLESELQLNLLERSKGRVFLTKQGSELAKATSSILADLHDAVLQVQGKSKETQGSLHIGVSTVTGKHLLMPKLMGFRALYPKVQVVLHTLVDTAIEEGLKNGSLDFGFMVLCQNRSLFAIKKAFAYEEYLYGSSFYLKNNGFSPSDEIQRIFDMRLIDFTSDFQCFAHWLKKVDRSLTRSLQGINPVWVLQDHEMTKTLIENGEGIAMLPTFVVSEEEKKGSILRMFPELPPTKVSIDLVHRKKGNFRPYHEKFIESVTDPSQ